MPHEITKVGFLRLRHIIGDPKSDPPICPIIPVSRATWWAGVKDGKFPKSIKIGGTTCWRVEDIYKLIDELGNNHGNG